MISNKCSWRCVAVYAIITATSLSLVKCTSNQSRAPISQVISYQASKSSTVLPKNHIDRYISTLKTNNVFNRSYNSLNKGSYSGSTYQIKNGDTLFYVAWITGKNVEYLAQINNIQQPYRLKVGKILQVSNGKSDLEKYANLSNIVTSTRVLTSNYLTTSWHWPTAGTIIEHFSATEGGNKGVDISGSRGQPIIATANGKVVYAGNALLGYGNLIILKHNDDYLSAYAHNDKLLVNEQEEVKAGQPIATMGSTGASSVRLHFEIRYQGKSVNPLLYLSG